MQNILFQSILSPPKGQYVDAKGQPVRTGHKQGQDAKDYHQQQTHIRNTD